MEHEDLVVENAELKREIRFMRRKLRQLEMQLTTMFTAMCESNETE